MNNASRNTFLAAATALTIAAAPSARADMRIHVNLPLPPSPRQVLRHLPAPPLPVVDVDYRGRGDRRYEGRRDGRGNGYWNHGNRGRDYGWQDGGRRGFDNRYRGYGRYEGRQGYYNSYRGAFRGRYDGPRSYYNLHRHRSDGWIFIEGNWVMPPFPGAYWVDGYFDDWGDWVPGYWTRIRPW